MRVVNLSQRPFLNRRPVQRVATLLWIVGALMLATNAWLFTSYLSGTTKNRERIVELNSEIDAAEAEFDRLGQRLSEVALGERNQRAVYLNELIDQRTFPWSRLFDDLEDALSDDVYLTLVSPSVEEENEPRARSRSTSRRMTPREARERARQRRSSGGGSGSGSSAPAALPTPESVNVAEDSDFALVKLQLQGFARSDDALLDFVDALYQNESFVDPDLFTEVHNVEQRSIGFTIETYYLLARRVPAGQPADGTDMAADSDAAEAAQDADTEAGEMTADSEAGATRGGAGEAETDEVDAGTDRKRPAQAPGSARGPGEGNQAIATGGEPAAGQHASGQDEETSSRDPRVRRPGTSTDRRRLDEIRSRLESLDESSRRDRSSENENGRRRTEDDEPELTEPPASATPRLRRQGSLEPPPFPFDVPPIQPAASTDFEEASA